MVYPKSKRPNLTTPIRVPKEFEKQLKDIIKKRVVLKDEYPKKIPRIVKGMLRHPSWEQFKKDLETWEMPD